MHLDVVRLRDFYHTPLGLVTARLVGAKVRSLWPDCTGLDVLGLGYATPYLGPFAFERAGSRAQAGRVINLMAASQGVHSWTPGSNAPRRASDRPPGNLAAIAEENAFPLPDGSMDRILLAHILETSDRPRALLREIWRVLAPGGRIIAIVPNRRGLWSTSEQSPFSHGRPYSRSQLKASLADHLFTPTAHLTALFAPPFKGAFGARLALALEDTGGQWWPRIGGVHIIEAEKRMYAGGPRTPVRVVQPVPVTVPE